MLEFRDRVTITTKTRTQGDFGPSWETDSTETRWARVVPISAYTRAQYQQAIPEVDYKLLLRGDVTLSLDEGETRYEFTWVNNGNKTLRMVAPPEYPAIRGEWTTVLVKDEG